MKTLIILALAAVLFADTGLDFPSNFQSPVNGYVACNFINPQNSGLPFWGPGGAGATYIWKYRPRQQAGYYVTMWWSNNGGFLWDGGSSNTYYGGHPYPHGGGGTTTTHDWEIATDRGGDYTVTRAGSQHPVAKDVWYTQALRVIRNANNTKTIIFYINLPSVANADVIQVDLPTNYGEINPPSPALTFGDSPWFLDFYGNERLSGILRHIKIFNKVLSEGDALAEAASENLATSEGTANIWYMNINPTPDDITDHGGKGHHFAWANSNKATLWSSGPVLTVTGLSVTPASSSVEELLTRQFTATATFNDNSTQVVSTSAAWSSTNTTAATVNGNGLATGQSAGAAKIIATYSGFKDTAALTVTASTAVLDSLVITGSIGAVVVGQTAVLSAMGHYSNGLTQDKTASATWSSSNNGLATVGAGVVTGAALGTVTITAAFGGKQDTAILQVMAQPAFTKKINFQPSASAVPAGYEADDGSVYNSTRGYGWAAAGGEARERNVNPDKRFDTFLKTYSATNWTLDLPSPGNYKVTAAMGDVSYATANTLMYSSQTLISAASSTNTISVTDTLAVSGTQLVLSVNGAFCFVEVESMTGGTGNSVSALAPGFKFGQSGPNPFYSSTTLRLSLETPSRVGVRICNQQGRVVRRFADELRGIGNCEVSWDGRDHAGKELSNGVYIAQITVNHATFSRKMILVK